MKMQRGIGISEPITEPRLGSLVAPKPVKQAPKAERTERPARRDDKRDARSTVVPEARPPRTTDGDGSVKFFNSGRGYGFITPDGGDKDLFVHFSAIIEEGFKTLDNGARVAYQVRDGRNGQEAFDVRVVG
jgi:CspA family cold shock protein